MVTGSPKRHHHKAKNKSNHGHRLLDKQCPLYPQAAAPTSPLPHLSLEENSAQALALLLGGPEQLSYQAAPCSSNARPWAQLLLEP